MSSCFADYPSYHRKQLPERVNDLNVYQQSFNDRDEITPGQRDDSEWILNENEYEREREDRNLRLNVPLPHNDRRIVHEDHGPLPPENLEHWDKINNKNEGNLRSDLQHRNRGYHKTAKYDNYDNLKARRHIRHREDSNVGNVDYDIRDSSQDSKSNLVEKNEQYEEAKDSVNPNVDLSSKKSYVFNSEENRGIMSDGKSSDANSFPGEKKIPPIPLTNEAGPMLADDSGFQGNQLQTEKEAFAKEAADTRVGSSTGQGTVMVKGKVKQVKADIDQGPNPEKTYKRVEDFFQTQRESSIVEVPNAVKKEEASKLFKDNFIPVKEDASDQINKEQGTNSSVNEVLFILIIC